MTLRSEQFDDVYFSAENGLAETRHVFLDGNGLPEGWADADDFVIAETGFGTGLNFLAVWKLFDDTAKAGQRLTFVSVEKYPLLVDDIRRALSFWDELSDYSDRLCAVYSADEGVLDVDLSESVRLTVYFDDVVAGLARVETPVDAWFFDGFKPSSNPDMWSEKVFEQVARLSRSGTRFATFTAVGYVRRGLKAVGFDVKRIDGYGWKWHMLVGTFIGDSLNKLSRRDTIE